MIWLYKLRAFLRRDFLVESSYKLSFLMRLFQCFVMILFFHFLSRIVSADNSQTLRATGGDYFAFVVIGLAFAGHFDLTLRLFSSSIRQAQVNGCLEAMVSTQTEPVTLVLMSSAYGLLAGTFQLLIYFFFAALFFGMDFSKANFPAAIAVFFLATLAFLALGVLSAAAIVWLKKGDPVTWLFSSLGTVVGGAYFPVDVMPHWLQVLAYIIPIRHALDALRLTLLQGYSLTQVGNPVLVLAIMTAVLLPLSLQLFVVAVKKAKREGTLMQY